MDERLKIEISILSLPNVSIKQYPLIYHTWYGTADKFLILFCVKLFKDELRCKVENIDKFLMMNYR